MKKILQEQNKKLFDLQNQKVKKLKQSRGKNLRGELARNKNLQRRFERGERRYAETQEPRVVGDPQVVVAGGGGQAPMTQEDRQLALARLQVQAQQNQFNFQLQDRRDREELAIRRGEAQGNLLLGQQRLAQDQEDQRGRRAIDEGNARLQAAIAQGNMRGEQFRLQRTDYKGQAIANRGFYFYRNNKGEQMKPTQANLFKINLANPKVDGKFQQAIKEGKIKIVLDEFDDEI